MSTKVPKSKHSRKVKDLAVIESEPLAPANKTTARKAKHSRKVDDTTDLKSEQSVPAKKAKTTVGRAKCQHEGDDTTVADFEQSQTVPTKKVKTAPTNTKKTETNSQSGAQRSSQPRTTTPKMTTAKRAQRTKEEIATDKAKAEVEKIQQKQLTEEKHQAMIQMDAKEGTNRAETAARAIRTFSDFDHDSAGEEFVGYKEVLSGHNSDESESHSEDTATLKVRFPNGLKSIECTYPT